MALKSLKKFLTKKSIETEVNKWKAIDCMDYLSKHEKDKSQNHTLKNKIEIVKKRFATLGLTEKDGKSRREALKYTLLNLGQLAKFAPKSCQDPKPNEWPLEEHQKNTGVGLWKNGYDVVQFLGAGGFGVVWEAKNPEGKSSAVKVTCGGDNDVKAEVISVEQLKKLFLNDKSGKAQKYLNSIKHIGGNIFEAVLAIEDLFTSAENKLKSGIKKGKTIESILRKARQALKAVKVMHDAGYSHNDIKPENFLKINNFSSAKSKYENGKKQHKHRIQLGDFGFMSEINNTNSDAGTPRYMAPDIQDFSPQAVAKRDVYSLGVTFLFFLVSVAGKNHIQAARLLCENGALSVYNTYDLNAIYGGTSRENMIKFLDVIKKMTEKSHRDRYSVDQALDEVQKLKGGM